MRLTFTAAVTSLAVCPAIASEATIAIEIPRLSVVEYHRPYVAFWLESNGDKITNLAVWYDTKLKDNEGTKWLKDMRQWWRRTGRELSMPSDGLSSPTRAPGTHQLSFYQASKALSELAPGSYSLVVEAAREVGGRELLRIPFEWPPKGPQSIEAKGEAEIGAVTLKLAP